MPQANVSFAIVKIIALKMELFCCGSNEELLKNYLL